MKKLPLRSILLLVLASLFLLPEAFAQDEKLPRDPVARRQATQALQMLRSQLRQHPEAMRAVNTAKFDTHVASADSTDEGGIAGRIEGIAPGDSAWVLAVAAHLFEDPTAWAFGDVMPEGDYVITGLSTGAYLIMAGADGYFPQFFSHAYNIWEAVIVEVAPQEMTAGIDFFLEPLVNGEGSLTGEVVAEDTGDPLAGVQLYAFNATNPFISVWTESNDDGSYAFNNLRSGTYYVQAHADGYFTQYYDGVSIFDQATPVTIADGEETSDINFAMNRGGTISGTIVDAQGDPIYGANIQAYTQGGRGQDYEYWYGWASSDQDGNYTISGLNSGDYIVSASYYGHYFSVTEWYDDAQTESDATPVPVILGQGTDGIDFTIDTPTDFGSVAGNITNEDGAPVQNAIVRLESVDSPNFFYFSYAFPDENGNYVIEKAPAGEYRVILEYWTDWFYDVLWYDQAESPEDATPIEIVADEQVSDINFVIPVFEGVITGRVTNVEGKPIANAHIQLNNPFRGEPGADGPYIWAYANTDADGNYRIEGLPDGEYVVSAFFCYFWECTQRWWPDSAYEERAEPIIIVDGLSNPASVDFELPIELGDASISGVVNRSDTGEPLAGALISIIPDQSAIDPTGTPWASEMHTYTDSMGAYSFNFLPAGTFVLYASYWEDGASGFAWYENAQDITDATPIGLGDNEVRENVDFSLDVRSYFGTLAGTVQLEDGSPIERAYIEVNSYYEIGFADDFAFYPAEWYAVSGADGKFEIDRLYEGEYMISVYAQGATRGSIDSSDVEITHIRITGGEVSTIDISMIAQNDGPAEIGGIVSTEQGDALEVSIVKAIPVTDDGAAYYTAIADENGVYRLTGLPEGSYYVQGRAPGHLAEYYDNTYEPENAELVDTQANAPAEGIDFSLEPFYFFYDYAEDGAVDNRADASQTSSIYGTVHNASGETLAGATIYVVDENGDALLSTEAFDDGSYELAGIQPGLSYRVKATRVGYESQFNGAQDNVESAPALTMNGARLEVNFSLAKSNTSVSNEEATLLPQNLQLLGSYPNPFSASTNISFSIPQATHVSVEIFDTLGRRVESIQDGVMEAGKHDIRWQLSGSYPSGLYFYRITAGDEKVTGTMTRL